MLSTTSLVETPLEDSALHLTWDEMIYLHKNQLALRGVPNEQQAYQEQNQGGTGDAISLATFAFPGVKGLEIRERVKNFYGIIEEKEDLYNSNILGHAYTFLCLKEVMDGYLKDMQILQKHLLEGIEEHIQDCVNSYGARAFIVMKHHAKNPYDYNRYLLGKCGKKSFEKSAVKAVIVPDEQATWNDEYAYHAVIAAIKKLYRQSQPDYRSAHVLPTYSLLSQTKSAVPITEHGPDKAPKKRSCLRCIIL